MSTKSKKSEAMRFLDKLIGEPETFGGLLEAIRLSDEVSQANFAKKLGISRSQLCDIEKGRKKVSPERAARYAKILGYSELSFVELALQDLLTESGMSFKVRVDAA
jgi:transcriptional regulator with XRE-family HTH domain